VRAIGAGWEKKAVKPPPTKNGKPEIRRESANDPKRTFPSPLCA
jgi:hypothetical protein